MPLDANPAHRLPANSQALLSSSLNPASSPYATCIQFDLNRSVMTPWQSLVLTALFTAVDTSTSVSHQTHGWEERGEGKCRLLTSIPKDLLHVFAVETQSVYFYRR
jgi:hypothetical protein